MRGVKREFFSIGKATGLHVMAYRSDIGNALLLCSYLYSAEYVSVNMTNIFSVSFSPFFLSFFVSFLLSFFFGHIAFLTPIVLSFVILSVFFCYYFIVVNVGTRACICPRVLCLLRMKEKCS